MPNNDYWKKRMESIEDMSHKKGMAYTSHIDKQFRLAEKRINQKIEYWYARIAQNNEVSLSAANEMLRADELEDFHLTLEEYIEKGKALDFDNRWMQQLENASAKVHIRRLEALQLQMQQECEVLFGNMTDGLDKTLTDVYTSAYYNTAYEFMRGHGVGWAFNKLDIRKIEQAINTAWAYDKKTFKARCWTNKEKLVHELKTTLTQSIIRGESPQKAIDQLAKRMKVSRYNAGRLIMTESCAISTIAQKGCYNELGVEKFEFVATLDSSTSDVCRSMDGQIFNMSDYKIGVNVPPLHCFCRSCTVPYYEDDFGNIGERAARGDNGKTYHVTTNMKYDEWYKKFVDNNGKEPDLQEINPQTIDDINKIASDKLLQSYDDRRIHFNLNETTAEDLKNSSMNSIKANYDGVSVETARAFNDTITQLSDEYYTGLTGIEVADKKTSFGANFFARTSHNNLVGQKTLILNPHKTSDYDKFTERIKELSDKGYAVKIADGLEGQYIATHEFAHTLLDLSGDYKNYIGMDVKKLKSIKKEIDSVYYEYKKTVNALESAYKEKEIAFLNGSFTADVDELAKLQKESQEAKKALDKVKISKYSLENADEFMAEAFTQSKIGVSTNEYSERVMKIIDENFKK